MKQTRTGKRYYKIGEKVFIKEEKTLGLIKNLVIKPTEGVFKAVVETTRKLDDATIVTTREYDLWEIDKDKNTLYKAKRQKDSGVVKTKQPTILFAKVREDAIIPSKNVEDAGYDIYANFEENSVLIEPNEVVLIPTGIASSLLDEWVLIAKERGSTGTKAMSVRAGVIDSSYRGEIFIAINNTNDKSIAIAKESSVFRRADNGDVIVYPYEKAIAQLLLVPVPKAKVKEISYDELKAIPSVRGEGALGSSNK